MNYKVYFSGLSLTLKKFVHLTKGMWRTLKELNVNQLERCFYPK